MIDQLLTKEKFNHDIEQAVKERTRLIQSYERLLTRLAPSNTTFGEPIEPEKKRPARIRESVFIPWLVRSHSHLRTYLSKERYVA